RAVRPNGVGRGLEAAPLRWVGRLSYSLYLWQQLFFCVTDANRSPALGRLQSWPWCWLALFACAAASHYLVERPLTRLGRRLTEPARPAAPPEPQVFAWRVPLAPAVPRRLGRSAAPARQSAGGRRT